MGETDLKDHFWKLWRKWKCDSALLLQIMQLKNIPAFISAASTLPVFKTDVLTNFSIVLQPYSTQTATMNRKIIPVKPFIVLSYFLKTIILKDNWVECLLLLLSWFQTWSQCFVFPLLLEMLQYFLATPYLQKENSLSI